MRWFRPRSVCRRKTDGTLWYPSHPGYPWKNGFYFRSMARTWLPRFWKDTGETWHFTDYDAFEILD